LTIVHVERHVGAGSGKKGVYRTAPLETLLQAPRLVSDGAIEVRTDGGRLAQRLTKNRKASASSLIAVPDVRRNLPRKSNFSLGTVERI
jgi:hypothetical protein